MIKSTKKIFLFSSSVVALATIPLFAISCSSTSNLANKIVEEDFNQLVKEDIKFNSNLSFNPLLSINDSSLLNSFISLSDETKFKSSISFSNAMIKDNKFVLTTLLTNYEVEDNSYSYKEKDFNFSINNKTPISSTREITSTGDIEEKIIIYYGKEEKQKAEFLGINQKIWDEYLDLSNSLNSENSIIRIMPEINTANLKGESVKEAYNNSSIIKKSTLTRDKNDVAFLSTIQSVEINEYDTSIGIFDMGIKYNSYSPEIQKIINDHDNNETHPSFKYSDILTLNYKISSKPIFGKPTQEDIDSQKSLNSDIAKKINTSSNNEFLNPSLAIFKEKYFIEQKPTMEEVLTWNSNQSIFGAPQWYSDTFEGKEISFSIVEAVDSGDGVHIKITISINIGRNEFQDSSTTYVRFFNIENALFSQTTDEN